MENSVFEGDSLSRTYLKMAMPVVFSMVITIIYNIADTFFIAQTQNTALVAGVSLCAPVFTILMAFGNIFGQGGSSLLSRLLGQNDVENMHHVSSFCFYISLIFGLGMGVLMLVFHTPFLHLLGAAEDTISFASEYYTVMAIGAPFLVASFIHSNLLRCEGMAMESMVGTVGGAVINVILDPILISMFHMGARGAAIASVFGYFCSDVYFLLIVLKKSRILSIRFSEMKVVKDHAIQIFAVGTAAAVSNWMSSLCQIVTNQFLLNYGSDKIAAMGIALRVSMIVLLVVTGLSFGGAPLIGYYFGAQKKEDLKKLLKFMFTFIGSVTLVLTAVLLLAAPFASGMFLTDAAIVAEGTLMLRLQVATMILAAVVLIVTIVFQASGKAGDAMMMSLSRQGVIFLVVIAITSRIAGYHGILAAQPVADVISAAFGLFLLYKDFYVPFLKEK